MTPRWHALVATLDHAIKANLARSWAADLKLRAGPPLRLEIGSYFSPEALRLRGWIYSYDRENRK